MIEPINEITIICNNDEQLLKISLIFLAHDYYWHDTYTISPVNFKYPIYICISKNNLLRHHQDKNGRISLSTNLNYSKKNNYTLMSYENFINIY